MNNDKELENSMSGFKALFNATCHPVFGAIYLYEQRTKNVIKLQGFERERVQEDSNLVNNDEISI